MTLETWFTLPTSDWAGSLVSLSLAIVSAGAALYASLAVPWAAELAAATGATRDANGNPLSPKTTEGARALSRLAEVRDRDPGKGVGAVVLVIVALMTALGVVGGLQIPKVGWLFTVVPVVVAACVAIAAALIPGRRERPAADIRLGEMRAA
jgi:amino acid transporter